MGNKSKIMNFSIKKEITLTELMQLMMSKLKWIILFGLACAVLVGGTVKLFVTPMYKSFTSLYVHNDASSSNEEKFISNNDLLAAESLANTYVNILQRNVVLDDVLEEYRANSKNTVESMTRRDIESMLKVSIVEGTQLIEVAIESDKPIVAYEVAEAYAVVSTEKLQDITQAGGVHMVDRPEIPTVPVSPNPLFDAIIGFFVGIVISVFFFLVRTLSDNTVYLAEDVISITDIPVFATIPDIKVDDIAKPKWGLKWVNQVSVEEVFGNE